MNPRKFFSLRIPLVTLAMATLASFAATAQTNAPLTGRMATPSAAPIAPAPPPPLPAAVPLGPSGTTRQSAAPATASTPAAIATPASEAVQQGSSTASFAPARNPEAARQPLEFGQLVHGLLAAQADGRASGPPLPMLGEVSTASWERYMKSFTLPIPQWFEDTVNAQGSGSSGGQ